MGNLTSNINKAFKAEPQDMPDYVGAAKAQGSANLDAAIATALLNRPEEITPYGTKSWTQSGSYKLGKGAGARDVPLFTSNIDFTPEGRARYDQEQRIIGQMGNIAESGLGRVGEAFSKPFGMDNINALTDKAQAAIMSRLNPMLDENRAKTETQLMTRGHNPQNESYGAQMRQLGQQENDARTQSILHALNYSPQLMQQEMAIRNQPLNELNALRSGSQVQAPSFNANAPTSVTAAPIFAGVQADGAGIMNMNNLQAAQDANLINGLFGLGRAALGGASKSSGAPG